MTQNNNLELIACTVGLVSAVIANEIFDEKQPKEPPVYRPIGKLAPKDVYTEIAGSAFFKRLTGIDEPIFDYIVNQLRVPLSKPKNIYFEYTDAENDTRIRRKCKLSVENRLLAFLFRMKDKTTLWHNAFHFGWNVGSLSKDFQWIAITFDKTLEPIWIKELNQQEKQASKGLIDGYNDAVYIVDGKHFVRRRSKEISDGTKRTEWYSYKHRNPEGQNVQAKISPFGMACEVITDAPAAMNDASLSGRVCQNNDRKETLADKGYPVTNEKFILPDGEDQASQRVEVENFFAYLGRTWKLVGGVYNGKKEFHSIVIRCAFILTNMQICYNGGLRNN